MFLLFEPQAYLNLVVIPKIVGNYLLTCSCYFVIITYRSNITSFEEGNCSCSHEFIY